MISSPFVPRNPNYTVGSLGHADCQIGVEGSKRIVLYHIRVLLIAIQLPFPHPIAVMQLRFASFAVINLRRKLTPEERGAECANKKAPLVRVGAFYYKVPGSDLLSHANAHYHRRDSVSRPCSGWEGVGPKRYGRQA